MKLAQIVKSLMAAGVLLWAAILILGGVPTVNETSQQTTPFASNHQENLPKNPAQDSLREANSEQALGVGADATNSQQTKDQQNLSHLVNADYKPVYQPDLQIEDKFQHIDRAARDLRYARNFNEEDLPRLINMYRNRDLVDRRGLSRIMAYLGTDQVFEEFMHTVFTEFKGQKLSDNEEGVLDGIVGLMGMVARNSNKAYQFIVSATDYHFWEENRTWEPSRHYIDSLLAAVCVRAVGVSGRKDAAAVLERIFWTEQPPEMLYGVDGSITSGLFKLDMIKQSGDDHIVGMGNDPHQAVNALRACLKSPDGLSNGGARPLASLLLRHKSLGICYFVVPRQQSRRARQPSRHLFLNTFLENGNKLTHMIFCEIEDFVDDP